MKIYLNDKGDPTEQGWVLYRKEIYSISSRSIMCNCSKQQQAAARETRASKQQPGKQGPASSSLGNKGQQQPGKQGPAAAWETRASKRQKVAFSPGAESVVPGASSTLGWSDFHFFSDFRKWAHCNRLVLFLWVQLKKIVEFCRMRGKVFIFKKSQGP